MSDRGFSHFLNCGTWWGLTTIMLRKIAIGCKVVSSDNNRDCCITITSRNPLRGAVGRHATSEARRWRETGQRGEVTAKTCREPLQLLGIRHALEPVRARGESLGAIPLRLSMPSQYVWRVRSSSWWGKKHSWTARMMQRMVRVYCVVLLLLGIIPSKRRGEGDQARATKDPALD